MTDSHTVVRVRTLKGRPLLPLPRYQTEGASGLDLPASEERVLNPGAFDGVGTGLAIELPPGTEAQVRPRSGLARKYGVTVLNAPGTIDADYRGEIVVLLINHGPEPFVVRPGDRIAQLVIVPVMTAELEWVTSLGETARGAGGFGHTGKSVAKNALFPSEPTGNESV